MTRPGGWAAGRLALSLALLAACPPGRLAAQSRFWRPEERTFIADLSTVTAVAATRQIIYAATLNGLAVYDRNSMEWRETAGVLEGFPRGIVTAMAADPVDDTAWMAQQGRWLSWQPFLRRFETGTLPGQVRQIVLDAANPGAGAYFATSTGWYFVPRGGIIAERAQPPRSVQPGAIGPEELRRAVPAFDAIRSRIETDELMRTFRITSAARVAIENSVVLGTDGNGAFLVDGVTHQARRLPMGLSGDRPTALGAHRGMICAGAARRGGFSTARTAVTCFDESLRDFTIIEDRRAQRLPGADIRRVLVTDRAVWIATDAGVVRAERGGSRIDVITTGDGLPSSEVYALALAPWGVWAGTARGLARIADTARAPRVTALASSPPVLSLAPAGDTLLVGTMSGLALVLPLADAPQGDPGPGPAREPVLGIATRGEQSLAITARRAMLRTGGAWQVIEPGRNLGELSAVAADSGGFWVAGSLGFAFFDVAAGHWFALLQDDVPVPVRDIVPSRGYVFVATDAGVVRFERRLIVR